MPLEVLVVDLLVVPVRAAVFDGLVVLFPAEDDFAVVLFAELEADLLAVLVLTAVFEVLLGVLVVDLLVVPARAAVLEGLVVLFPTGLVFAGEGVVALD